MKKKRYRSEKESFGKKALALIAIIGLITGIAMAAPLAPDNNAKKEHEFIPGEIVVKYKEDKLPKLVKVASGSEKSKIEEYKKDKKVAYAELNYKVSILETPNDPSFSLLWGMDNTGQTGGTPDADIDAQDAWDIEKGNENVNIAVIDTGTKCSHPDLPNVDCSQGYDFYNNDPNPEDDNGHGTHVAGTIGGAGNNSVGVVGVNWNTTIIPIKFLGADGSGSTYAAAQSISYATSIGVHIMSNSWGGGGYSQAVYDAIADANSHGILFVAAAGNSGSNNDASPSYPASYDLPNVVAVAATDHNDQIASWSNYGAGTVHLGAPGVNIYSTVPDGSCSICDVSGYKSISGTSMATPHVSGVAGLIKAHYPELASDGIKTRLLGSVDQIPSLAEKTITGGRLNAYNALETDNIAPAAISDLSATNAEWNSITLQWTSVGDDGSTGTASSYDLRYSSKPITDLSWNEAAKVSGLPRPKSAGGTETFKVSGLQYGMQYYFAARTIDNVGNPSEISNVAIASTTAPYVVLLDDMENGTNGWTHSGAGDNWQLGTPTSGPGSAYSGLNVWATNLAGNYGTDNMNTQLVSPQFSLSGLSEASLVFQQHFQTESYYDGGIVEITVDGGSSWNRIAPEGGYPEDALYSGNPLGGVPAYSGFSQPGWHQATFNLTPYVGNSNVMIRFHFGTDYSVNSYPGWYLDDIAVLGSQSETPPPPTPTPTPPLEIPPTAIGQSLATDEDMALPATLTGSDENGDQLTFQMDAYPQSGFISLDPDFVHNGKLVYMPGKNFNGNDAFTFTVNDGLADSYPAIVEITVNSVNDAPVANAQNVMTNESVPVKITLAGSDVDSNVWSYKTVMNPLYGTLSLDPNFASNGILTYMPKAGFSGLDSFEFVTNDSMLDSLPAKVNITVNHVPQKCWDANNAYLVNSPSQAKKFAKCASGSYSYSAISTISGRGNAYKYVDAEDNQNWTTASAGSTKKPIYRIKSISGIWYTTNKDYYLP